MLSLSVVKGAASSKMAEYYTKEYTQGSGEMAQTREIAAERSRWWGDGAEERGLEGVVEQEDLQAMLEGKDPKTGQLLFDPTAAQLQKIQRNLEIERTLGKDDIQSLRDGLNPETGEPLPRVTSRYVENLFSGRRGLDRSVSAVDLTLSAPKSVSLMVAVGDEEIKQAATEAHEAAVDSAMKFVKEELVAVRRGHDGLNQEQADAVAAALVTQLASRNHDPQLHTHCVLSTAARGPDGRVSALNATTIHKASKVIGSVYQQELRHQLTESLGVAWDVRQDGLGEVQEMPQEVLREFSTRSADIGDSIDEQMAQDQRLLRDVELRLDVYERSQMRVQRDPESASEEDHDRAKKLEAYHRLLKSSYRDGKFDASRRRLLVQLTRPSKDEPAEAELREQWQDQWERSGYSWESVISRSNGVRLQEQTERIRSDDVRADFRKELERALVVQNATFGRKEAITAGLRVADPDWDSETTLAEVESFLEDYAVSIREDTAQYANWTLGGGEKYTTENVIEQERELKEMAGKMLDRDDSAVCDLDTAAEKAAEYTLNDEQEELLSSLTVSGQQLVMARGIAGSGKTHVLGSAASVLRTEGHQVVGLATAAATAQRLSSESGFDRSSSIDRFLQLAENGKWERGTSPELLAEREELQSEKREILARFADMSAEAGDDEVALDEIAEQRAAALEEWQGRWDEWLKKAGREQEKREQAGEALQSRREMLDATQQDLDNREAMLGFLPPEEQESERKAIREGRYQLAEARERLKVDTQLYREHMSPTQDLPDDNKVVLVVDEAGMVETEHYHRLVKLAEERDWKVAFVGDDRQLQEVNRGGAFRMLSEMGGSVELGTARRARNEWEQQAQRKWWATEDPNVIEEVAQSYIDHDRVTFVTDRVVRTAIASENLDPDELDPKQVEREVARQLMVDRYFKDYDQGVDHLLVASTREDVFALNKAVQDELLRRGDIKESSPKTQAADVRNGKVAGHYDIRAGDKVLVMQNISGTPIKNGMSGEAVKVMPDGGIEAKLPTGPDGEMRKHTLEKDQLDAGRVALGNAVTAHKSQGMSVESATALGDSSSQRLMLYPAMTRGKGDNHIVWLSDKDGPDPEEQLAKAMTKSARKLTALESWSKEPAVEEVEALLAELRSDGVTMSYEEAYDMVEENRRREYLRAKEDAAQRDAKMSQAHEKLNEQKQSQMMQQAKMHTMEQKP